jgi:hypothetical protein
MPLVLSQHKERTRTVPVAFPEYEDDPTKVLHVSYRPRAFEQFAEDYSVAERQWKRREREIDRIEDELDRDDARATAQNEQVRDLACVLAPVLTAWDLFYDADQTDPVPIDVDGMMALGFASLKVVIDAIVEDMQPRPNGSSASGEPSSPGAPAPTALQPVT